MKAIMQSAFKSRHGELRAGWAVAAAPVSCVFLGRFTSAAFVSLE
jgi:hypothetical protein